jgi:hypothetical protein
LVRRFAIPAFFGKSHPWQSPRSWIVVQIRCESCVCGEGEGSQEVGRLSVSCHFANIAGISVSHTEEARIVSSRLDFYRKALGAGIGIASISKTRPVFGCFDRIRPYFVTEEHLPRGLLSQELPMIVRFKLGDHLQPEV